MEQYIPGRRIKPVREGSSRLVLNKPNVPPPEIRSIQELRITLLSHKPIDCNGYQHKPATVEDESGLVKAVELTPSRILPLLDVKSVSFGGGRIIGGGTSREAIRTAKKQAKRNPHQS